MKHILDMSNIVFGGYYGSPERRVCGFPCGGLRKALGLINADYRQAEHVLCFDGGKTIKKELLPRYKAGRVPNYAVIAQLDLLREILTDCGIPFYWDERYEADDFICSVVHFLSMVGDTDEVSVYSDDRDLACCVNRTTDVRNVTTQGTSITMDNYEERVVRGMSIPYNGILLYKMMFGDKSDNYLGLNIPGLKFEDLVMHFSSELEPYLEDGSFTETAWFDINIANILIDCLSVSVGEDAKDELKKQAKIVYPQLIQVSDCPIEDFVADMRVSGTPLFRALQKHLKIMNGEDFDVKKFQMYCSIFGLGRYRINSLGDKYEAAAEEFKNLLSLRAKDLSSGVLAVEHYRKNKVVKPQGDAIPNMELPL